MRVPLLPVLLAAAALLGGSAPSRASEPSEAASTLARLDDASRPLSAEHDASQRQAVLPLLAALAPQLDGLPAPADAGRRETLERLRREAARALEREREFWAGRGGPAAGVRLDSGSARSLVEGLAALRRDFASLYPEALRPPAGDVTQRLPGQLGARADETVGRGVRRGRAAGERPAQFFDGSALAGGDAGITPNGDSRPGGVSPAASREPLPPGSDPRPLQPAQRLRTSAVPEPGAAEPGPGPAPEGRAVAALRRSGPVALRDAVRSTPVLGATLRRAADARTPEQVAEETACRAAMGESLFAGSCGSGWAVSRGGTLLAGVVDAFKEQFSGQGLVMNLVFMLGGIMLGALTGGVGMLANLVRALLVGALLWTALSLLGRIGSALATALSTPSGDPRHWQAVRLLGKLGGELMILVLLGFLGWRVGQMPAVRGAANSMMTALRSKLGGAPPELPPALRAAAGGGAAAEGAAAAEAGAARSNIRPPEPPPAAANGTYRQPTRRHRAESVTQQTVKKEVNTLYEPWVNVAEHARALNMGEGTHRVGRALYTVAFETRPSGRAWAITEAGTPPRTWRYGVHENSFHPIEGPGFHTLSRHEMQAFALYNEHGVEAANAILARMRHITQADRDAALRLWRLLNPG